MLVALFLSLRSHDGLGMVYIINLGQSKGQKRVCFITILVTSE